MIEDLTMLATQPVTDAEVAARAKAEVEKAAAAETMPLAKPPAGDGAGETDTERLGQCGQEQPEPEKAAEEDS